MEHVINVVDIYKNSPMLKYHLNDPGYKHILRFQQKKADNMTEQALAAGADIGHIKKWLTNVFELVEDIAHDKPEGDNKIAKFFTDIDNTVTEVVDELSNA